MSEELRTSDNRKLVELEKIIEEGLRTFTEVGSALLQIRDDRLYRANFKTFEEYCQQKWAMDRSYAYRLINSAKVVENLKVSPIGDKMEPPATEALTRPLALLPPEQQADAWQEAQEKAPKGEAPTASLVQRIVDRIRAKASKEKRMIKASEGWTADELKDDTELFEAFKAIAAVYGNEAAKAIRTGTVQLQRSDVTFLANLPTEKMREIQNLVLANCWTPKHAVEFLNDVPDDKSTVEDLKSWCLGTKNKFYSAVVGGFTITCRSNRTQITE